MGSTISLVRFLMLGFRFNTSSYLHLGIRHSGNSYLGQVTCGVLSKSQRWPEMTLSFLLIINDWNLPNNALKSCLRGGQN